MNAVTEVMDELRKALAELEDCRARNADLRTMLEQVTRDRDHVEESLVRLEAQRDEARSALAACPDCAMWAERSARWHDDMQRAERERDEARAEVERQRELKDYLRTWLSSEELEGLRVKAAEHPLLWEEIHHLKAEVERLSRLLKMAEDEAVAADDHGRREARRADAAEADAERLGAERDEALAEAERLRAEAAPMNEHFTAGYRDGYRDAYRRGAEAMREACAVRAQRYLGLLIVEGAKTAEAIRNLPIPEDK